MSEPESGPPRSPSRADNLDAENRLALDAAVAGVVARKDAWLAVSPAERAALLHRVRADCARVAANWVAAACAAKGVALGSAAESEEWLGGPFCLLRYARRLERTLCDIARQGRPPLPGGVRTRADGQVTVRAFPLDLEDRLLFLGFGADLWLEPGVRADEVPSLQARPYQDELQVGRVVLVLGAGNVSSIAPTDTLHQLFIENHVVVLKTSPVNRFLMPYWRAALRALIEPGFMAIVAGEAAAGAYLCHHAGIDEIHITGSDATHDTIVFGPGTEGAQRKAERRPLLAKRITSELGNVSPVIIVPGPWSQGDFARQAANISSQLVNNAGFNCNAARVVIQHAGWDGRERLVAALRDRLAAVPPRRAYYPGAAERFARYRAAHPDARPLGNARESELPWLLVDGLDADAPDELCFETEAFCSVLGETALAADNVPDFIARAVDFANTRLLGTLNACLLVHPASLRDPAIAAGVDRAVAGLRYGTVAVNHWPAVGFALGTTTWGAFPGHDIYNVGSGIGTVHNALMLDRVQKSVVWGPFHAWPTPPWFVTARRPTRTARRLVRFEAAPSLARLLAVAAAATLGV
jgi:acyl-CoA reductase-like NAD-dependent aldehyde dehydrogenase